MSYVRLMFILLWMLSGLQLSQAQTPLSLAEAIRWAQHNDPWLQGSYQRQQALWDEGVAAAALPDPRVALTLANLATDSFDFDQEPMTQLRVGVSQRLPRGQSRQLRQRQLQQQSQQQPWLRQDRQARVALQISQVWLQAYLAQCSLRVITQSQQWFEQRLEIITASYAAGVGAIQQQDLLQAELALTQLQQRWLLWQQRQAHALQQLRQWLVPDALSSQALGAWTLLAEIPELSLQQQHQLQSLPGDSEQFWLQHWQRHPALLALEVAIQAQQTGIALAQQNYQPEWGLHANYAYREDDPFGESRADFFSLGVSFDVPWSSQRRQDPLLRAAKARTEAIKSERDLLLRQMLAEASSAQGQWQQLVRRDQVYQQQLIPQLNQLLEAALAAYTHDQGDFTEVLQARIAQLDTQLAALAIQVEMRQHLSQLRYFFTQVEGDVR